MALNEAGRPIAMVAAIAALALGSAACATPQPESGEPPSDMIGAAAEIAPLPAEGAGAPAPAEGAGAPLAAAEGAGAPAPAEGAGAPAPAEGAGAPLAAAGETAAGGTTYFVHGYNPGSDANCSAIWGNATNYFKKQGSDGKSLKTVGYYKGDTNCDVSVSKSTTDTRIKDVAADFANYIYEHNTKNGESVDIVAHSMGGLVTRVALLGSAKGWEGFPKAKLKVGDVVTLGTPHKGVRDPGASGTTQWKSMDPGSEFMKVLHAPENRLSEGWASGTDWTFVSSDEDGTVSGDSAIDEGYHADHKLRYLNGNNPRVTHPGIREIDSGKYNLRYWHSKGHGSHDTKNGWFPVKTAYQAVKENGKW